MLLRRMKPATRYPADPRAVFILTLAIVAGFPLLLLDIPPDAVDALMPPWAVVTWGTSLVVGAAVTLAGMSRQTTDGIIVEQIGSVIVGCTAIVYGAAVALVGGPEALVGAAIIVGFGASCFWRWGQLQALLSDGKRIVDKVRANEEGA